MDDVKIGMNRDEDDNEIRGFWVVADATKNHEIIGKFPEFNLAVKFLSQLKGDWGVWWLLKTLRKGNYHLTFNPIE